MLNYMKVELNGIYGMQQKQCLEIYNTECMYQQRRRV
jgi:hypothetical protein